MSEHFSLKKSNLNGPYLALKKITNKLNLKVDLLHSLPWKTKNGRNLTSLGVIQLKNLDR